MAPAHTIGAAVLIAVVVSLAAAAPAFEALDGQLIAKSACPASRSIRGRADETLKPGRPYVLLGANRPSPSHYQVRTESGQPRWVAASCGVPVLRTASPPKEDEAPIDAGKPSGARDMVLAVNWQPAVCEAGRFRPECRSQSRTRFDATNFALHGLWPQPRDNVYCGVDQMVVDRSSGGRWAQLPALPLDGALRRELDTVMPGTASYLHRHEWTKHGTCYAGTPEAYFRDALALMRQLNASSVRDLFAGSVGRHLTAKAIRSRFDAVFGPGAGRRVSVTCATVGRRRLVVELRIALTGRPGSEAGFADLIAAAPEVGSGCAGGIVDAVGSP